jgi:hypothetical protein
LTDVSYRCGRLEFRSRHASEPEAALPGYLDDAHRIIAATAAEYTGLELAEHKMTQDFEELRWFPLPGEVLAELRGHDRAAPAVVLLPSRDATR